MTFEFPSLIAHAARARALAAGSSGLAEVRMLETLENGAPKTSFLNFGDTVRNEMLDSAGATLFGAIEQKVVAALG